MENFVIVTLICLCSSLSRGWIDTTLYIELPTIKHNYNTCLNFKYNVTKTKISSISNNLRYDGFTLELGLS